MKQIVIIFLSIFLLAEISLAEDNNAEYLICRLSEYFKCYYNSITQDKIAAGKEKLIFDIKHLLEQYGFTKENLESNSIEELQDKINQLLKGNGAHPCLSPGFLGRNTERLLPIYVLKAAVLRPRMYKKEIVLFLVPDSEIVNCWLGDLVEKKYEKRNIWGKEIDFIVKAIDNLEIRDFTYVLTKGRDALDVGTRDNVIYYNLEAYKMRAIFIWNFFTDREEKNKRYDPSKSNRLRKWLYYKTWADLYVNCIKDIQGLEEARVKFIEQVVELLKENSLFHEIGHIFSTKYLRLNDESEEEIIAFLSELRYGPLPYESMETLIAASYKSSMDTYNLAGRYIIYGFIFYIKNEQKNKNPEYKDINIQGRNLVEKINSLYKLTKGEIQGISEYIYKEKRN